jgi:iron-sulfur cluster repair protein YtfE (RIC family)
VKRDPSLIRLSRDHQRGLALAQRIERVLGGACEVPLAQLEREVIEFWRDGLLPHFRAECECLLARLLRHTGAQSDLLTRTERDHVQVHGLIASLRDARDDGERYRLLGELGALLKEHIRWEEATLFEAVQTLLTREEIGRLGADLADRLPEMPPAPDWIGQRSKR